MTPNETAEIFKAATAAYHKINRKLTCFDVSDFDEKVNAMLVEMPRDADGDEYGILCLNQLLNELNALTGSTLARIGKLPIYNSSITFDATEGTQKSMRLSRKRNLMIAK